MLTWHSTESRITSVVPEDPEWIGMLVSEELRLNDVGEFPDEVNVAPVVVVGPPMAAADAGWKVPLEFARRRMAENNHLRRNRKKQDSHE